MQIPKIGGRTELFADGFLLDRLNNIDHRLNPPERREIVFRIGEVPWEGEGAGYFTVLQAEGRIRMYYRAKCTDDLDYGQVTCVAESRDGIRFSRPELDRIPYEGKKTNIIWTGIESHNFTPFYDTNPDCPENERYKALAGLVLPGDSDGSLFGFVSPDGLYWEKISEKPLIQNGTFDSQNLAFYDNREKVYRCYNRYFLRGGYSGLRAIQSCTSPDFLTWTGQTPNRYEPPQEEHYYTNATIPCPGAEHLYLSFPKRFVPERKKVPEHTENGLSDAVFLTSRDGQNWDRTFREAWIRPGYDRRNWTDRNIMPALGTVEIGGEHSFYITEHYRWDDMRIRRAAVRRHGFASLHAGPNMGTALTRPFAFEGDVLHLNLSTSAAGSLRAALCDEAGKPFEGFGLDDCSELYGDGFDETVTWTGGGAGAFAGRPVRLFFELRDADLYAFCFASK